MTTRPTHEVMRDAVDAIGVKRLARELDISASLIYKWCQEPKSDAHPHGSGTANPLDRLLTIHRLSGDTELLQHLCRAAGGFFTPNPAFKSANLRFVTETIQILDKFADLIGFAERSLRSDDRIDKDEAVRLRREWDALKSRLEHFILCCEGGAFDLRNKTSAHAPRRRSKSPASGARQGKRKRLQ